MNLFQDRLVITMYDSLEWEHQFYEIREENFHWKGIIIFQGKNTVNLVYGIGIHNGYLRALGFALVLNLKIS